MTKIKFCGLSRICDIEAANALMPDYIGFVFAGRSRRYVSKSTARELKRYLDPAIQAVGVFVNEDPDTVAGYLEEGVIDIAQLHGSEDEGYLARLRAKTDRPVIQAFRVESEADVQRAGQSTADFLLLDSGAGTGTTFDWKLTLRTQRPFFLAGGLSPENVENAVRELRPYAVDVSSGIETDGRKDRNKMAAFFAAVRRGENR